MLIVHIIIIVMFLVLGIIFWNGKGAFLIAGYNTLSKSEKAKYNEKELCRFMGKLMFVMALCFAIIAIGDKIGSKIPLWIGLGLFFGSTIFTIIYCNTGNRFKNK